MNYNIFYKKVNELIEKHQNFAICTITKSQGSTPRKIGTKMIVLADGSIYSTIGGGSLEFDIIDVARSCISQKKSKLIEYELKQDLNMACGGKVEIFIEPIIASPHLVIFGAGHIGSFLAQLSPKFGFFNILIDNRPLIFEGKEFENTKLINLPYEQAFEQINFDENTYICILTHGHEFDKQVAAYCLKQKFAYIGIISSKAKTLEIANYLKNEHNLPQELIDKIDMPIGIPFNAQTPEEIAISILAKLIDVKNSNS